MRVLVIAHSADFSGFTRTLLEKGDEVLFLYTEGTPTPFMFQRNLVDLPDELASFGTMANEASILYNQLQRCRSRYEERKFPDHKTLREQLPEIRDKFNPFHIVDQGKVVKFPQTESTC